MLLTLLHILLGAWWEVDLGKSYAIASANVTNREDCCGDRLSNSDVILKSGAGTNSYCHIAIATDGQKFDISASDFLVSILVHCIGSSIHIHIVIIISFVKQTEEPGTEYP